MKKPFASLFMMSALLVGGSTGSLFAEGPATQTVTYTIPSAIELAVSGSPTLTFGAITAGENFTAVSANATYILSCNKSNYKVQGKVSATIPDVSLSVQMAASGGATSAGTVVLSTTDQPLLTSITRAKIPNGSITYSMAPSDANVIPADITGGTVIVTFTLSS